MTTEQDPEPRRCSECDRRLSSVEYRRAWPSLICDDCKLDELALRHRAMSETAGIDPKPQS